MALNCDVLQGPSGYCNNDQGVWPCCHCCAFLFCADGADEPYTFLSLSTTAMSQTSPETNSRADYQVIFDSALEAYKKKTGKDLTSDPLLCNIETCHSPNAILGVLRAQTRGLGRDRLLTWLNPIINVLNAFSATIGGGVGLVRPERLGLALQNL